MNGVLDWVCTRADFSGFVSGFINFRVFGFVGVYTKRIFGFLTVYTGRQLHEHSFFLNFFFHIFLINNTNPTYNNNIANTTYSNNSPNNTDITYNTIDTYDKYYKDVPLH